MISPTGSWNSGVRRHLHLWQISPTPGSDSDTSQENGSKPTPSRYRNNERFAHCHEEDHRNDNCIQDELVNKRVRFQKKYSIERQVLRLFECTTDVLNHNMVVIFIFRDVDVLLVKLSHNYRHIDAELLQGALLVPHLYSTYTLYVLRTDRIVIAQYADHSVIGAWSFRFDAAKRTPHKATKTIVDLCIKWKITINAEESQPIQCSHGQASCWQVTSLYTKLSVPGKHELQVRCWRPVICSNINLSWGWQRAPMALTMKVFALLEIHQNLHMGQD